MDNNERRRVAELLYDMTLLAERVKQETEHFAGEQIQEKIDNIRRIMFPDGKIEA